MRPGHLISILRPSCKSLQSKAWKHPTSPPPVKFRKIVSTGKVMACVFLDSEGVLMIDCLERGKTVTGVNYAKLLRKLRAAISCQEQTMWKVASRCAASSWQRTMAAIRVRECGFELLNHPPYSTDLAPSDFRVFRSWNIHSVGRHLRVINMSSMP